jgi:hypothetical protein
MRFPTIKSVICSSVEDSGGNSMPGVHSFGAIESGRTTQCYTLVGLVANDTEKHHIRKDAGSGWNELPMMESVHSASNECEGEVCTIEVDMC